MHMAHTIAVCPGSFDPVTLGHVDIIKRTAKMFDKVFVVVMANVRKSNGAFSPGERVDMLRRSIGNIPNVIVEYYDGLLADYVVIKGAVAIVKGLRAVSDYEDEFQQALTNKRLAPGVETIFLVTNTEYMFLSSSLVKEVCRYGGDIEAFVPAAIKNDIMNRLRKGEQNER